MSRYVFALALIGLIGLTNGCGEDTSVITASEPAAEISSFEEHTRTGLPGRAMVLRLFGSAVARPGTVPDIDGDGVDDDALCFDIDILDAAGNKIGTATDCLSNIVGVGDGMALVGTTYFHLRNGTFVSRGSTTVQPVTTTDPTPATHATGAIPMPGSNGIIAGDGAFAGLDAEVRLSGAVNLSRLDSEGRIAFDCLFAVTPQ